MTSKSQPSENIEKPVSHPLQALLEIQNHEDPHAPVFLEAYRREFPARPGDLTNMIEAEAEQP